jgi:hypothetical protein
MEAINVTGTWTAVITYGEKYKQFAGKELFFEADLTQEGQKIYGTSKDIEGIGKNPTPATLSGSITQGKIKFVKRYEALLSLNAMGDEVFDKTKPGLDINYSGVYDHTGNSFSGHWEYRIRTKTLYLIPYIFICGGNWSMKRKPPLTSFVK